jgi:uncharacterized membrane-anchored protein YitT (DUF2179 family)
MSSRFFQLTLGITIFVLGSLPYAIAGYEASVSFTGGNRIYSASVYGISIVLASLLTCGFHKKLANVIYISFLVLISVNIAFTLKLAFYNKRAAFAQKTFFQALLTQVPNLEDDSRLVLLDCQQYVSNKATVMDGIYGTSLLMKMIYNNPSLSAVYAYSGGLRNNILTSVVSSRGFKGREWDYFPIDRLVIFRKSENDYSLVDMSPSDDLNVIWDDHIQQVFDQEKPCDQ